MGLLDLIAAKSPSDTRKTIADLLRGPSNRLSGLLSDPAGFMNSALREGLGADQQEKAWAWRQGGLDAVTGSPDTNRSVEDAAMRASLNNAMLGTVTKFPPRGVFLTNQQKLGKMLAHDAEMFYDKYPWASHKTPESYAGSWSNSARDQMRDIAESQNILSSYEKTGVMPKDKNLLDFLDQPPPEQYAKWLKERISRSTQRLEDYQSKARNAADEWTRLVEENPEIARQAGIRLY